MTSPLPPNAGVPRAPQPGRATRAMNPPPFKFPPWRPYGQAPGGPVSQDTWQRQQQAGNPQGTPSLIPGQKDWLARPAISGITPDEIRHNRATQQSQKELDAISLHPWDSEHLFVPLNPH